MAKKEQPRRTPWTILRSEECASQAESLTNGSADPLKDPTYPTKRINSCGREQPKEPGSPDDKGMLDRVRSRLRAKIEAHTRLEIAAKLQQASEDMTEETIEEITEEIGGQPGTKPGSATEAETPEKKASVHPAQPERDEGIGEELLDEIRRLIVRTPLTNEIEWVPARILRAIIALGASDRAASPQLVKLLRDEARAQRIMASRALGRRWVPRVLRRS